MLTTTTFQQASDKDSIEAMNDTMLVFFVFFLACKLVIDGVNGIDFWFE